MREEVHKAVTLNLAALREEDMRFRSSHGVGLFTATHIQRAMAADGNPLTFYTVPVLLKLLELFADHANAPSVILDTECKTNVFLGADCDALLCAMTVKDGRAEAQK